MSTRKPRVLLLVPPGPGIYIRDNYCSYSSKADYYWPPIDLVVQSGILRDCAEISVLDATAERLNPTDALDAAEALKPDVVLFITGPASIDQDLAFITNLKSRTGAHIYGSGGNLTFWGEDIMASCSAIDGILLEFISDSMAHLVAGDRMSLEGLLLRENGRIQRFPAKKKKNFRCGIPQHTAFPLSRYKVPQAKRHPLARTLTSFGCSYQCDYCIEGRFPLVYRDPDEVCEEFQELARLQIPEIYFMDNVLTAWRERFLFYCRELEKMGCFSWFGQCRVDNLDEEIIIAAKRAGCHFMMIGVETGSSELLSAHHKGHGLEESKKAFALLRKHGIETLAYFMLGLTGETPESMNATLDFALQLPCDYATFSITTPDPGTPMREEAIRAGDLDPARTVFDSTTGSPLRLKALTQEQLRAFQKKTTRSFYLRPNYLLSRLAKISGPRDLLSKCRTAYSLLFSN